MGLFDLFRNRRLRGERTAALYSASIAQARHPVFFTHYGAPDTVDGRFDLIILHIMLLVRRLRENGKEAANLSQDVLNLLFADMDRNLREMGIGDLSVGKHVKRMAKAFYGRAETLEKGLDGGDLEDALAATLYRAVDQKSDQVQAMAAYIRTQDTHLAGQDVDAFVIGAPDYLAPQAITAAA
jgi:cytochrome b pre-mRNA-processing protein 3